MELEILYRLQNLLVKTNTIGCNVEEFQETDRRLVYFFELFGNNLKTYGDAIDEQNNFLEILQIAIPDLRYMVDELIYNKTQVLLEK